MPRRKTSIVSLEEAKARFEAWRQNRQGKAAIPDELWAAAVEVARKEGVSRTATELHVEWNHLKRRMAAAGQSFTTRLAANSLNASTLAQFSTTVSSEENPLPATLNQ